LKRRTPERQRRRISAAHYNRVEAELSARELLFREVVVSHKPLKEGHRRLALHDERLLPPEPPPAPASPARNVRVNPVAPKPPGAKRARSLSQDEARHLFAGSRRTGNSTLRSLLPDEEQLKRYGLPVWGTEADLAAALNLTPKQLRFFSIHRAAERVCHYVAYTIPKASGGVRLIMAPKKRLKSVQRRLLQLLLSKLPHSDHAHGFLLCRSVRTGAEPHVGRKVLLQMDVEDFFPTISYGRVRGLMIALGYGYPVASALAALMTEAERQPVEIDGVVYHVPVGRRHAVQGAPTSPGLSNCIVLRLDRRLAGLARAFGFRYTRYADDLTFSGDDDTRLFGLRRCAEQIITEEGFRVNVRKTHVSRSGQRQRVTGVTVNEQLGLSRKERRRLRAAIHQMHQARAEGNADPRQEQRIKGELAWLAMLNPQQAEPLKRRLSER
jgi:RNA-directed DNA polymerase